MKTNFNKGQWFILIFTIAYILAFLIYYLSIKNYEFLWYIGVILFFFGLIFFTLDRTKFDNIILGGLSLWGLLHMAGGGIVIGGKVLYALEIIPLFRIEDSVVLKFDQLVHAFGFGLCVLVVYHLLLPYLNQKTNWKVVFPVIIMTATGLGALNEIIEFIAVLSFPETGVGGYTNTSLDLVFNLIGASIAVTLIKITNYKNNKYESRRIFKKT